MTKIKKEETKISVLTRNNNYKKTTSLRINLKVLNGLVFALILVSGAYHIIGANALTVKGFELMDLKKYVREISSENNSLETKITAMDSYNDLGDKIKKMNMVSVTKMNYIENKADIVAKK